MTRLLNKSIKIFIGYSALVLACSIPAYYVLVDQIWQQELKEHNQLLAASIKHNIRSLPLADTGLENSIQLWNHLQPEMRLKRVSSLKPDSIYNVYRINKYKTTTGTNEDRFQGLVTYLTIEGKSYSLTLETNMEEAQETILGLTLVSVIFFIILLAGLILLNRRLSARIWKPFYESLKKIQHFDLNSRQHITFDKTDILEFEALNTSLDRLISGNLAAYLQQKHFTENASHELQTPLAIVQSKLDIFLQDASLTDKQSGYIEQAQDALSRVNRVNRNLLLLAKIDNLQFPEKEAINLSALLPDNLDLMDSFIVLKHLQILPHITPNVIVNANKALTDVLLSNLLMNAIRHTADNGRISIRLTTDRIEISNTGLNALQHDQLFKRFGRASNLAPATGLGLAIAYQVCRQNNWNIAYDFKDDLHVFTVSFIKPNQG